MKKVLVLWWLLALCQLAFSQNNVTIYWDASYSMKDRDIDKEFGYLQNYFKKYKDCNVRLVTFSNDIIQEENLEVRSSNWENLKKVMQNTVYDGATSYARLFEDTSDSYMIFTDGNENLDMLEPPTSKPIHIISTEIGENAPRFKRIADASNGSYVVISNETTISRPKMQPGTFDPNNDGLINGVVTDNGEVVIPNVNIINKRTGKSASTTADGNYSIEAEAGDVLAFSFLGKKTVSIKVVNEQMNIVMTDVNQELDEVLVEAEIETEELVNVGNKIVDKKRIGYSVESIDDEDISELDTDVQQAVKGQFAGLHIANDTAIDNVDLSQFIGRGKNGTIALSQYGLIVVDGVPQQQSNSGAGGGGVGGVFISTAAGHINPDMIADITYLKGLAATNRYGTLGRNGVLLITTKASILGKSTEKKQVRLGTTDTYTDNATLMDGIPNTKYIQALKNARSVDEAFDTYLEQRKEHGTQAEFYLDAYDYFKGWNNPYLADRILSNIYEIFFNDASTLRALSYKQIENGKYKEAVLTNKRILKLTPNSAQAYRNMAQSLKLAGNYEESMKIYDRIDKGRNVGNANFSGIETTITNDFKNLMNHHKSILNTAGINPKYLQPIKYKSRIVFEWSNPDTEFDLQIVNPQKRFFTWEHTKSKSAQRLAEEKQQGYGMEEFFLTQSDKGEWLFNVKYFGSGKNKKIPVYLKVTIYRDFGFPNETMQTKVIRLFEKGKLQTAVKLSI